MSNLIENIIENIKKYPVLFDISHPHFKKSKVKDKAWDELGEDIQEDVEVIKKKWKNLKDSYLKHLKTKKVKSGEKIKTIERYRAWPWAKQMEVFKPYLKYCQSETFGLKQTDSPEDSCEEYPPEMAANMQYMEPQPGLSFHQQFFEENYQEKTQESSSLEPTHTRKRRKKDRQSSVERVISYLKNKSNTSTVNINDPTELIFLGYAKTIQKLSPERQSIVKLKIAKLIMEEELQSNLQRQEMAGSQLSQSQPVVDNSVGSQPQSSSVNSVS